MSKGKVKLKTNLENFSFSKLIAGAPISHLDDKVRFSFRNCDTGKLCIRKLLDNEIERFYERLAYFENMTWQQVKQIPSDKGFSTEKKDSDNFSLLQSCFPNLNNFFHFRVNGTDQPFRVFGSQFEDLCFVLWIDREGSINH